MDDTARPALRLTRELVKLVPERVPDPGPIKMSATDLAESYHRDMAVKLLEECQGDGFWVLAIGSLIWNPRCDYVERRRTLVEGWQRKFCLGPDTRYRGNPTAPGLMLSLDRGGRTEGVVFRLNPDTQQKELTEILVTEPPIPPAWVTAQTDQGPVQAIAFVCPRTFTGYAGNYHPDAVADHIVGAVGMLGSMADYLLNTVEHLESAGIHDPYLWDMQDRVAARLEAVREGLRQD